MLAASVLPFVGWHGVLGWTCFAAWRVLWPALLGACLVWLGRLLDVSFGWMSKRFGLAGRGFGHGLGFCSDDALLFPGIVGCLGL